MRRDVACKGVKRSHFVVLPWLLPTYVVPNPRDFGKREREFCCKNMSIHSYLCVNRRVWRWAERASG